MIWIKGSNVISNGKDKIEIKELEETVTLANGLTVNSWGLLYNGILVETYESESAARTMFAGINPTIDDTIFNVVYSE